MGTSGPPRAKWRKRLPWLPRVGWFTFAVAFSSWFQATSAQDNLCYLAHGRSSETFTVNEALPVETVIGRLQVEGNASEGGDIELRMAQKDAPLAIEPQSQSLILRRRLDKEGIDGLRSVSTEVICSPRHGDTLSIRIPIRIIVTDANDNAPEFQGTPYLLNVSEATVPGSTVMQGIRAVDKDQPGAFSTVEYYVENGPHSHLLEFESRLEGTLVLRDKLDYETLPKFTVTLRAQDQGDPPQSAFTTLTIIVHDADDQNPRFLSERYYAQLNGIPRLGVPLDVKPSRIHAEDPDEGIRSPIKYIFNSDVPEYGYFELHSRTGQVSIRRPLPEGFALPVTLVVRATQEDNPDRFTLTTLTITRDKFLPHELRFLQTEYDANVLESTPPGQVVLTLQTTKATEKNIQFQLLNHSEETFAIRPTGEIILTQPLDYEQRRGYYLQVLATDGKYNDVAKVNVTVINVNDNDPKFLRARYSFVVTDHDVRTGALVGKVSASDADSDDNVELSIDGPSTRLFAINNEGEVRIRDLDYINTTTFHLVVVATDSGIPPRKSTALVEVQFPETVVLGSVVAPKKDEGSFVLMIVFGALLGSLLLVIVTLTVYILKNKKYRNRIPVAMNGNGHPPINKVATIKIPGNMGNKLSNPPRPLSGVENPIFNLSDGKSDDRAEDDSDRGLSPSTQETPISNGSTCGSPERNGHIGNGRLHALQWPMGSIPRRVKKLSWEDEQPRTALDPDVSVTPMTTGHPPDHNELTVYF